MKILVLLGAIALGSCGWETPTAPPPLSTVEETPAAPSESVVLFTLHPDPLVVPAGTTRTAIIRGRWPYPLGVLFFSADESVMRVSGRIAPGQSEGTVQITGVAAGSAPVMLSVLNFARAPGTHRAGTVIIAPTRARAVRH